MSHVYRFTSTFPTITYVKKRRISDKLQKRQGMGNTVELRSLTTAYLISLFCFT